MAISQSSALCMDQWRELFTNAGVDIFEIIQRSIKIAASDRPNEFKNMRGNIAELLFACKYVHNSDDNNLGTVEHKATGHQFNNNEDVSRGDKELMKGSLDGGMDVKGKMVGCDEGIEESCLNEWEGLACPPLDDYMFSYAQASLPQIDLSTFFDGIDDDGEVYNKKKEETPNKKRQGKQLKLIMEAEIEKQSTGLKPIKHSGYVEKRLHIPATSGAPKRQLARQQHEPRVLAEETCQKKLGVTKRKFEEENRIAKQMKMQRRTDIVQDVLRRPQVLVDEIEVTARKSTEEKVHRRE